METKRQELVAFYEKQMQQQTDPRKMANCARILAALYAQAPKPSAAERLRAWLSGLLK